MKSVTLGGEWSGRTHLRPAIPISPGRFTSPGQSGCSNVGWAPGAATSSYRGPLVRGAVLGNFDWSHCLKGNTHPLARPEFDSGAAPASLPMEGMLLVLNRSTDQEAVLEPLLEQQWDKSSPNFLKWLTPEQFGAE
jgi:hypothetical protein